MHKQRATTTTTTTTLSLLSLILLLYILTYVNSNPPNEDENASSPSACDCNLYLTKSSIPNAGFGIYAGPRGYAKGEYISTSTAILLMDYGFHNSRWEETSAEWRILEDYYWDTFGPNAEFETDRVKIMISDFGAYANYHPHHVNVGHGPLNYRDDLLDARYVNSPGAGAFSYYDVAFYAEKDIQPFEEMFVDYGETWGDDREYEILMAEDYEDAEFVVDFMMRGFGFLGHFHGRAKYVSQAFQRLQRIIDNSDAPKSRLHASNIALRAVTHYRIPLLNGDSAASNTDPAELYNVIIRLIKRGIYAVDPAVSKLLPNTRHELLTMYRYGITSLTLTNRVAQQFDASEASCLDHLERRESELKWAGNGAFATRNLTEGSVVAPMPFLHIFDRDNVNMYSEVQSESEDMVVPNMEDIIGKQLNLNYCFGRSKLPILLCSYSSAQMVNHQSAKACADDNCLNGAGPNVGYRWASPLWDGTNAEWRNKSIIEIQEQTSRGLSFELYALRNITVGEEITMDYGDEWDEAWRKHVVEWSLNSDNANANAAYTSVVEMNSDDNTHVPVKTKVERESDPYPANIGTVCFYWVGPPMQKKIEAWRNTNDFDIDSAKSIRKYAQNGKKFYPDSPADEEKLGEYWPCEVYFRDINRKGEEIYTVRIFAKSDTSDPPWWLTENVPEFVQFLPRKSIRFVNLPNHSEQFLRGAFRHPIGIRDGLLPAHWLE